MCNKRRIVVRSPKRDRGFTLLELIVALGIFSVISLLAFGGLRTVQTTKEHVEAAGKNLTDLQMAFTFLGRDLSQSIARSIRDDFGDFQPAMRGSSTGIGTVLEFTRAGLRNPTGRPRSYLERVAYGLQDDKLIRYSWPMLDRAQGIEPREIVLLEKVKKLEMRFLDPQRTWKTDWPPLVIGDAPVIPLPRAVEVTIEMENWGTLIRLFRTAGEEAPGAQPNG